MRVMTRYPPTWRLHVGHLFGIVDHMVAFQDEHECFFMLADWHALLLARGRAGDAIDEAVRRVVVDWLATGVDPQRATVFRQSEIPEIAELAFYLASAAPRELLLHNEAWTDQLSAFAEPALDTYGLFGYPVLMAADFAALRAELLPVGHEQFRSLEIVQGVLHAFAARYGPTLAEPLVHRLAERDVPGIDGRKMAVLNDNVVWLDEPEESLREKLRVVREQPGLDAFYAQVGDRLAELRERRAAAATQPSTVRDLLEEGRARVAPIAREAVAAAREALRLPPPRHV